MEPPLPILDSLDGGAGVENLEGALDDGGFSTNESVVLGGVSLAICDGSACCRIARSQKGRLHLLLLAQRATEGFLGLLRLAGSLEGVGYRRLQTT